MIYKVKLKIFNANCEERYENLAHKLCIFYDYCKDNYDGVIKVDDGCKLNFKKLMNIPYDKYDNIGALMRATSTKCHYGKCKKKEFNKEKINLDHKFEKNIIQKLDMKEMKYCGGGYSYFLSKKCLNIISNYTNHILSIALSYEDVLFGQILRMNSIEAYYYKFGDYHQIK